MTHKSVDDSDLAVTTVPRRWLLRALTATTVGVVTIIGIAGCGGEDEDEDEDDD